MKHLINMTLLSTALILLLSSCHKDTTKPNKEASEYFPIRLGIIGNMRFMIPARREGLILPIQDNIRLK